MYERILSIKTNLMGLLYIILLFSFELFLLMFTCFERSKIKQKFLMIVVKAISPVNEVIGNNILLLIN